MFYLLDKPKGPSSFKVIRDFAKAKKINKIGHTGTLDPLASGLLLVATDADTKLISYVDKDFKTYRVTLLWHQSSDTFDITGEITMHPLQKITKAQFANVLSLFEGKIQQMPPIFSAKKVQGKRAYELARQNAQVCLSPIIVEMKNFKIIKFNQKEAIFEVSVSRGTYIRSLVNDIGKKLQTGALMSDLRRISLGVLTEKDLNKSIAIERILIYPVIKVTQIKDLKNGRPFFYDHSNGVFGLKYQDDIIGIGKIEKKILKVIKLLGNKI